jgi:DNA (cytosine-5)-methyltransferase 1
MGTVAKLKALDLFCKAGGATKGLQRAGFYVVGVDIEPQPHYCGNEFHQADALTFDLSGYDFIWASPPCQDHMQTPHRKHGTGWMLGAIRERLTGANTPWVIENVKSAPLRADYKLCGCYFQLPHLRRERWFETSWCGVGVFPPHDHSKIALSVVGHGMPSWVRQKWGRCPTIAEYRAAMGIDWMNRDELSQAVPPAYSEYIGRQFLKAMERAA